MAKHKYLYVRDDMGQKDGKTYVNIHYLIGYCPQTITEYKKMLKEIKKDFPEATEGTVSCNLVTHSSYVKGFTLLAFSGYFNLERVEAAIKNGWTKLARMEYGW